MFSSIVAGFFQKKPDVVMATSPQFFAAVGGWVISFFKVKPFIFELGDLWPASIIAVGVMKDNFVLKIMEKLELFLYRKSTVVISLTNAFREDLIRRGIDKNKIHVIINGVDLSRYSPRKKDEKLLKNLGLENKFVIGYIGTHGMAHALEKVLDAAEILIADNEIRFLFVGSGAAKESLVVEAKKRGLKNIIFFPPQPKEKMPEFLSLLDVDLIHLKNDLVFTTVIPSKIFEAMGMGLPILLAGPKSSEASKVVEENGAGLCILSEDPEVLTESILNLKNNNELRKKIADASYKAASKYTRKRQSRELLDVIKGIIKE